MSAFPRAAAPKWAEAPANTPPPRSEPEVRILDTVRADSVAPEEMAFLWYPYIPAGKLTVLEGDPGIGKSWITCALAAAVTKGETLPGAPAALPPQNVLMASAEDGLADTIVPRLRGLGADMHRIFAIRQRFTLDHGGVSELKETMRSFAATIVFIDPIVAYLGQKIDMHRANEVRDVMKGIADASEETGCASVIVRHLRKGGASKGKAIYAGIGSIDFTAAARSVLAVEERERVRIMNHIKSNGAPKGASITYAFTNPEPEVYVGEDKRYHAKTPKLGGTFAWGHFLTAADPTEGPGPVATATKASAAKDFLARVLAAGPLPATEVERLASEQQISLATLRRVRPDVAQSIKGAGQEAQWMWTLRVEVPRG